MIRHSSKYHSMKGSNTMKKLKPVTKDIEETELQQKKHEENVKRGKKSRRKGGQYERDIADIIGEKINVKLKRTPQSGGFAKNCDKADDFRGDITIVDNTKQLLLHIECKNHKTWSLPSWLSQAESDCPKGRTPVVIFHKYGTSKDYVCLSLEDFLELVPKDKIVGKRVFR